MTSAEKTDNIDIDLSESEEDEWLSKVPNDLRPFCRKVYDGFFEPLDFTALSRDKPEWIDDKKVQTGQIFARKHTFSLVIISLISLGILYAENFVKKSFLFFGKADTPFKGLQRQLKNGQAIKSCYETEIWGTELHSAKKKFEVVLKIHKHVLKQLTSCTLEELDGKIASFKTDDLTRMLHSYKVIGEDFKSSCSDFKLYSKFNNRSTNVLLSQSNFMLLQLTFMGLAVQNPKCFGIYWANEEEWDGFVHVWRVIGHLLGIKDEYNICNADLETIRRRTKFLIDLWVVPALAHVDVLWEYLTRCTIDGARLLAPFPMINFETVYLFLSFSLGVKSSKLKERVGFGKYICYWLIRFLLFCQIVPGVPMLCRYIINKLFQRAENASPDLLKKWEEKHFFYVIQGFKESDGKILI